MFGKNGDYPELPAALRIFWTSSRFTLPNLDRPGARFETEKTGHRRLKYLRIRWNRNQMLNLTGVELYGVKRHRSYPRDSGCRDLVKVRTKGLDPTGTKDGDWLVNEFAPEYRLKLHLFLSMLKKLNHREIAAGTRCTPMKRTN